MTKLKKYLLGFGLCKQSEALLLDKTSGLAVNCAFRLSYHSAPPHISLMHFFTSDYEAIIAVLMREKEKIRAFSHSFNEITFVKGGWYFLLPTYPQVFKSHHLVFKKLLNEYFAPPEKPEERKLSQMSPREQYWYTRYGYPYFEDCFNPHLTITRTTSQRELSNEDYLMNLIRQLQSIDLHFNSIFVAELEKFGTYQRVKSISFPLRE